MAEFEPKVHSPEQHNDVESSGNQKEKLQELLDKANEARHEHAESHESIAHTAKQEALTAKETQGKVGEKDKPKHHNLYITKETKKASYKKTLHHVQRQLPKRERALSKVIHQPVVEKVSELSAKTIARPSGLLAGGVCAFVGSSLVFYMAKHYGFRYNFFVFIVLMVGGFGLGLLLELLWNATRKLRRS